MSLVTEIAILVLAAFVGFAVISKIPNTLHTPLMSDFSEPGSGARLWNSASEIKAAAPPPTPLKSATICGIAVILTCRAAGMPTAVPSAMPSAIRPQFPSPRFSSVATTAMPMPTAAMRLPRTAVVGPDRPRRPWMNREKATMYRT